MIRISEHFTLSELTRTKNGIANFPPQNLAFNGLWTATKLEKARAIWSTMAGHDCEVRVSYAYRCKDLNDAVGSSDSSAHMLFLAADAIPKGLELRPAWQALIDDYTFMQDVDQLIIERGCIHIGGAVPAHGNIPRHELRLDQDINGVRRYPLYGTWTPQGVKHA